MMEDRRRVHSANFSAPIGCDKMQRSVNDATQDGPANRFIIGNSEESDFAREALGLDDKTGIVAIFRAHSKRVKTEHERQCLSVLSCPCCWVCPCYWAPVLYASKEILKHALYVITEDGFGTVISDYDSRCGNCLTSRVQATMTLFDAVESVSVESRSAYSLCLGSDEHVWIRTKNSKDPVKKEFRAAGDHGERWFVDNPADIVFLLNQTLEKWHEHRHTKSTAEKLREFDAKISVAMQTNPDITVNVIIEPRKTRLELFVKEVSAAFGHELNDGDRFDLYLQLGSERSLSKLDTLCDLKTGDKVLVRTYDYDQVAQV